MTPSTPQFQQSADVHISEYLRIIMFRRRTFLLVFLAVILGVCTYTFTAKPVYEAFATVEVQPPPGGKEDLVSDLGGTPQNHIDHELEVIKSRTAAEQVIKLLHLETEIEDIKPLSVVERVIKFLRPKNRNAGATAGPDALTDAAYRLQDNITAVEVVKKSDVIRISYQSTDPQKARDVVNTLVKVYKERNVASKSASASKTVEFIESQLTSTNNDLNDTEKNLQNYKSSNGAVRLDDTATQLVTRLGEIDSELSAVSLQKKQIEYNIGALRDAIKRGTVHTPNSSLKDDAAVSALAAKLAELDVQRKVQLAELDEGHPQVKILKAQAGEVQTKLLTTYEAGIKGLVRQEGNLKQELARYERQFRKLPESERELGKLMRLTKVNADIFTFLLQKHEESRIAKASTISNISVLDAATTPKIPIKPKKLINLALGLLVGLILATGAALFIEYLDDTVKDAEGANRAIGAPVLATIPFIPFDDTDVHSSDIHSSMITHLHPKSAISEAFRSLRTNIHFSSINRGKKILLITSAFPGEGKSTISANLAITLSQTGARVLVIDGDLRRPSQHTKFGHSRVPGLSDILAGDVEVKTVLHSTGIPNLMLLTSGTTPPNPAELLGSEKMVELLSVLREQYDHIVIDAPPVLAVTDAPLLTSRCDSVLVVLETERVPLKAAKRMAEMLDAVQSPLGGIVINDKSGASMRRYGYYGRRYSGYGYDSGLSYYGEDEQDEVPKLLKQQKAWWKKLVRF